MKNRTYTPDNIIAREVLKDIGMDESLVENMSDEECEKELIEIYKAE